MIHIVSIRRAAEAALRERLVSLGVELDKDGRAEQLRPVVVDTVDDAALDRSMADLREGSGGELTATEAHRPKFQSAFSSCALAVNVFGPWRLDPASLSLDDKSGFSESSVRGAAPDLQLARDPTQPRRRDRSG